MSRRVAAAVVAAVGVAIGVTLAACDGPAVPPAAPGVSAGAASAAPKPGGSVFSTALGRIVADDTTRTAVAFSDNASLRGIGGPWEELVGYGSADLIIVELGDPEGYGIHYAQARYAVTAGSGPGARLVVLAGGQDAAKVRTALTGRGWTADGDRLTAPKQSDDLAVTQLQQVRAAGGDVFIGAGRAPLDGIVTDPGQSLAADPVLRSLAECLGDVLAADVAGTAAVGVLRPGADGSVRAVVCTRFADATAAGAAAERQRSAYATGRTQSAAKTPYAELYRDLNLKVTGPVVRVESTVAGPFTVLDAFQQRDVPGLEQGR